MRVQWQVLVLVLVVSTGCSSGPGGTQSDGLDGGQGIDLIYGGGGADGIGGLSGSDVIFGGAMADEIFDGPGADTIHGGLGNDRVILQGTELLTP